VVSNLRIASTDSSTHSLTKALGKTDIGNASTKVRDLEHCLEKSAKQISHLKTIGLENNYRAVETQIRIHNINNIKTATQEDFRNLSHSKRNKLRSS
jgi:hypothetical protein